MVARLDRMDATLDSIEKNLNDRLDKLESKIASLDTEITVLQEYKKISEKETASTQVQMNLILKQLKDLENKSIKSDELFSEREESINKFDEAVKRQHNQIEDQDNRSMRSTLVFKGIKGEENNWGDTNKVLVNAIMKVNTDLDRATVESWIDRAHRTKSSIVKWYFTY